MTAATALYSGSVMHRRSRPRVHALRFRMFWCLLDLDEIGARACGLRLFSYNRFNVTSFYDSDHGDGSGKPLRGQVERHLRKAGIDLSGGRILLFCMPRILGYGFNPISVYFCYARGGELSAILYEVHNTFGERHSYLIPVRDPDAAIVQNCDKCFYVSPFMDMDMSYEFRVVAPGDHISVTIRSGDRDGPMLIAALSGRREPFSDRALLRALVTHPLLTLKVIAAIHWHAVRLWWKGVKFRPRPRKPEWPVTIVHANG